MDPRLKERPDDPWGPAGSGLAWHHIIPYETLRDVWNHLVTQHITTKSPVARTTLYRYLVLLDQTLLSDPGADTLNSWINRIFKPKDPNANDPNAKDPNAKKLRNPRAGYDPDNPPEDEVEACRRLREAAAWPADVWRGNLGALATGVLAAPTVISSIRKSISMREICGNGVQNQPKPA